MPVIEFDICISLPLNTAPKKITHSISKILYYPNHSNSSKEIQGSMHVHAYTFTGLEKC